MYLHRHWVNVQYSQLSDNDCIHQLVLTASLIPTLLVGEEATSFWHHLLIIHMWYSSPQIGAWHFVYTWLWVPSYNNLCNVLLSTWLWAHRQTDMENFRTSRAKHSLEHTRLAKTAFKLIVKFSRHLYCFWYIPFIVWLQICLFCTKLVVDCVVYFLPVLTTRFSSGVMFMDCIKSAIL